MACGGSGGGGGSPAGPDGYDGGDGGGAGGGGATGNVSALAVTFVPGEFTVRVGQSVTWVNNSSDIHSVTSDTGAFPEGQLPTRNATVSRTFSTVGDFPYHCVYHESQGMRGIIHVIP